MKLRILVFALFIVACIVIIIGAAGCGPETETQATTSEASCKIAIGDIASIVVSNMPEDEAANSISRFSAIMKYIDEQGSFPAECRDFHLSQMHPWIDYASSLVRFCVSVDPHTEIDTSEDFGGRPLGEWLVEYQITCPLIN